MNKWIEKARNVFNPDRVLQKTVGSLIEASGMRYAMREKQQKWHLGEPLKLLLAGYVGTRNTGADVRVEEMIRQFRHIIGDEQLSLSIMTNDPKLTAGYFRTVRQIQMPLVFPKFLYDECTKHDGVIACEGSMFKSKFSDSLTTMMASSLGMANAEGKLSVGYGAEAGEMTDYTKRFVEKYCHESLIICRNEPSRKLLESMNIRTRSGTDTAWTFEPAPPEVGREKLLAAGWDGETPIVAICPINPFWWPVKPDLVKAATHHFIGEFEREHYRSIYFHHNSKEADQAFDTYLNAIAKAIDTFRQEKNIFPILVGMEQLDRTACEGVRERMKGKAALFISDEYNMYTLVSIIRHAKMLISSRYHAIVTTMPALVPSAGITMDERIRNLMHDRGHDDLFLEVDEEDLENKILATLKQLDRNGPAISAGIAKEIPKQLALMGQMGIDFMDELEKIYPEFPRKPLPRTWQAHLPPLSKELQQLL